MHRRPRHAAPAPAGSESQTNGDCLKRGRTSRRQDRNQTSPLGESRSQGLSWELGAVRGLPAPRRENIPRLPRQSLRQGQDGAIPGAGAKGGRMAKCWGCSRAGDG